MKLELNFPNNFPKQLIDLFHQVHPRLSKGYPTEYISLDKAIGRRVADSIIALNGYPTENLSEFPGWGIKSHTMQNIKNNNFLKVNNLYFWDSELYKSKDIYKIDYKEDSIIKLPKNIVLPSSIDAVIRENDSRLNLNDTSSYKIFSPIKKLEGVIKQGSIIKEGECLVQKDEKINAEKLIVLSRAGLKKIKVYKNPRIVIVSMYSYDTEEKKSEECTYVKNKLEQWGYLDIQIKVVKPTRLEDSFQRLTAEKDSALDATLSLSQEQFTDEFQKLISEYDLILCCSISHSSSGVLTLKKLNIFDKLSSPTPVNISSQNQEVFTIFRSNDRSPPIKETIEIRNSQGEHKGSTTKIIEDKAVIINLSGDINEITIMMHIFVKYIINKTDPKFIENNFHKGFIKRSITNSKMQLLFGNYIQDESGRFLIDIEENIENHKLSKFTNANCIAIIPNKAETSEIYFIKID